MTTVFISHAHEDVDFANSVIHEIGKKGFSHWIDSEQIGWGDDWRQEIDEAIRNSFALIVIVSPESNTSQYVTYEWIFALGVGIKVIPLLFKSTDNLHLKMQIMNWGDFTNPKARRWDLLSDELRETEEIYRTKNISGVSALPTQPFVLACLEDMKSSDERRRRNSIDSLAKSELEAANDALVEITLHHHISEERIYAATKMVQKTKGEDKRAILGLLECLTSLNDDIRKLASTYLVKFGNDSVTGLIALLDHEFSETRYMAAITLGELKSTDALPKLVHLLSDAHNKVIDGALDAIEIIHDESVISGLKLALSETGYDTVQYRICRILFSFGDYTIQPFLLTLLSSTTDFVRNGSAEMLIEIGDSVISDVKRLLQDKTAFVLSRAIACYILYQIGNPDGIPILIDALEDNDGYVRGKAAEALGHMRVSKAINNIGKLLHDEDLNARLGATQSLLLMDTSAAKSILDQWELEKEQKRKSMN